jgi:hypothetical protein
MLVDETAEQVPLIRFEAKRAPLRCRQPEHCPAEFPRESLTNRLRAHPSEVRVTLSFRKRLVQLTVLTTASAVDRVQSIHPQRGGIGLPICANAWRAWAAVEHQLKARRRWVTTSLPVASSCERIRVTKPPTQ